MLNESDETVPGRFSELEDAYMELIDAEDTVAKEIDKLNQKEIESYRNKAKEISKQIEKIKNEIINQQQLIAKAETSTLNARGAGKGGLDTYFGRYYRSLLMRIPIIRGVFNGISEAFSGLGESI